MTSHINKIVASTQSWRTVVTGAGLLALFVALMATIQFATPNLVGNDSYFHIKFAQVMRQQGLIPTFPWLPLTILSQDIFFDHHFLFHVLLIPFTYGDLREGAKWASVIFPSFAFLVGWIFLHGQRVPYAALWSLGFCAVSEAFLYRMSMTRVQSMSLLMLLLILHITLTRRYRWLLRPCSRGDIVRLRSGRLPSRLSPLLLRLRLRNASGS